MFSPKMTTTCLMGVAVWGSFWDSLPWSAAKDGVGSVPTTSSVESEAAINLRMVPPASAKSNDTQVVVGAGKRGLNRILQPCEFQLRIRLLDQSFDRIASLFSRPSGWRVYPR